MWLKKNGGKTSSDRLALQKSFAEKTYFIEQQRPRQNQQLLGFFLAIDWRLFLQRFDSPKVFEGLNREDQMTYFSALLDHVSSNSTEADRLRPTDPDKSFEFLCQTMSAEFIFNYLLCLIENDEVWRKQICHSVNPLIAISWEFSASVFPVNDRRLDGPLSEAVLMQ